MNFDKKTTGIIKGIALILMFVHHFLGFPEWISAGNSFISLPVGNMTTAYYFGRFGNICVAMFMFLTGYGVYFSYRKGKCLRYSLKKIFTFLAQYWILLFTFFIPVEYFCGMRDYSVSVILSEMFALTSRIVNFAWYVRFYVLAMLSLPLLKKLFCISEGFKTVSIFVYWTLCFVLRKIAQTVDMGTFYIVAEEYLRFMPTVILGYLAAEHGYMGKLGRLFGRLRMNNLPGGLLICAVIFVLRVKFLKETYTYLPSTDFVLVPFFIYGLTVIINSAKVGFVEKILLVVGANSMNLWFLQSVFYGSTSRLQFIAYIPKISVAIVIWSLICLIPVSWIYNKIFALIFSRRGDKK